ncbi:MAG: GPR1/FUN34/YaaH family transporter, partial [Peptococcaceae bacterium]|nr:GPR1/FUN34/YaaH family transporter [Peptococcaceae bacterium]
MSNEKGAFTNPAPAGLVALAATLIMFFAYLTGRVDHSAQPVLACWLIGGFVIQCIVGVIELKDKNLLGGNLFLWFSGYFMLATSAAMFLEFFGAHAGFHFDTRIEGWAWIALTVAQ